MDGAPDGGGGPPPASAAKPFLRRGAGWEARLAAAREGRRYMPRGGPVKDYSQEGEAPLPRPRRSGTAASGARKAAGPRSPAKPAAGSYARRAAAAAPSSSAAAASALKPRQPARSSRSDAASPQRQHPHAAQHPAAPPHAVGDWARRLLQAGTQPAAPSQPMAAAAGDRPAWEARQAEEEQALEAFEALESAVLREVQPHSPRPPPRSRTASPAPAKELGAGAGTASRRHASLAGSRAVLPPAGARQAAPASQQWPLDAAACGGASDGEEGVAEAEEMSDVFQSDGEGAVRVFGEGSQAQAAAAGIVHPLAARPLASAAVRPSAAAAGQQRQRQPPVYYDDDEDEGAEAEMQAESSFLHDAPRPAASSLVQRFFRPALPPQAPPVAAAAPPPPRDGGRSGGGGAEAEAVEALQAEVAALQEERARVARLRLELEEGAARLALEQDTFEKRKLEEAAQFEAQRGEELRKLQRDRRVLEKQSRAILKLPTKQIKEEVAAVEALLADERRTGRAREARHKLTVERLRQQVLELQERNAELRSQVAALEEQRLLGSAWGAPPTDATAGAATASDSPGGHGSGGVPAVQRHAPAAAHGRSSAAPAAAADVPHAAVRQQRLGGLPAVRVERGGGMAAHQLAAVQPPLAEEAEGEEQLIAEVRLSDDQVVVCEAPAPEESCGQLQQEQPGQEAGEGAAWSCGALHSSSTWAACGTSGSSADWAAAAPVPATSAAQPAGDTASRATSALARFSQLREALAQQRGLGSSRPGSLQASPAPMAALGAFAHPGAGASGPAATPPTAPATAQAEDDLRRLGRSLLAASGGSPATALGPAEPAAAASTATPAGGGGGDGGGVDAVVSEVQHPDGRWERVHASGLREQRFANGSVRQSAPGGASLTRFANGDVKKALPGGVVAYWYAEVDSWQVTHPSGVDVFHFASGQVEAHHPGGVKEIVFPDGAVRKALPDGRELAVSAAHLSAEIRAPRPEAALV